MKDHSCPPLPKYAKYLPEYEPTPLAAQETTTPRQSGSGLKLVSILLGILSGFTTIYLIASLVFAPNTPSHDLSVIVAEVMWVPFGLLPGMSALICWDISKARRSPRN
ncbi:MAG TPA: hypothetical protein VFU32_13130 [Ktedonobacterales bacterium]|nr:hypothetical protein [Ktedonobacterales bacterium]